MALSQAQIDAMSQATGLKYSSVKTDVLSLADKIRALKPQPSPLSEAFGRTKETFKKLGSEVSQAFSETPDRALEGATNADGTVSPLKGLISAPASAGVTLGKTAGAVARGAGALLALPIDTILTGIKRDRPDLVETVKNSQGYKDISEAFKKENLTPEASRLLDNLSSKAEQNPEIASSLKDAMEVLLLGGGGAVEKQIVDKGKKTFNAIQESIPAVKEVAEQTPKAFAKSIEEAVEITKPTLNDFQKKTAMKEGRVTTEGVMRKTKVKPSMRDQRVAESIEPLVSSGKVSIKNKPEVNIENISREVSRINNEVKNFIADNKIPVRKNLLKKNLDAVKKDSEIVFASDPTMERTYDALINEFMKAVEKGDTLGIFEARQTFDKIPAVKKLLDGMKGATGENLRRQAVLDIRKAANDYVADLLDVSNKSSGKLFGDSLRRESQMLEAIDNIASGNIGKIDTNVIQRLFKDYPWLKTLTAAGIGGAGVGFLAN